jgi:hypothetical protein
MLNTSLICMHLHRSTLSIVARRVILELQDAGKLSLTTSRFVE